MGIRRHIVLPIFALLVGGLLAELSLRLFGVTFPVFETYDSERGIKLKPGKEGWYRKEGNAFVRINRLGYRDVEHSIRKEKGVFRICVLGDSFMEARQVDIEATFCRRLEGFLSGSPPVGGKTVEVLSFGVGGYGTAQEFLTLRRDALRFDPDLVLLALMTGNDIADNSLELMRAKGGWRSEFRPFFVLQNGDLILDRSFDDFNATFVRRWAALSLVHHSRVLELLNQVRRGRQIQAISKGDGTLEVGLYPQIYKPPEDAVWTRAWEVTERLILQFKDESERAGAGFLLVTLSNPIQVHPEAETRQRVLNELHVDTLFYPEKRLQSFAEDSGVRMIALAPELYELAVSQNLFLHGFKNFALGRGHWNEEGHRHAADIIATKFRSENFPSMNRDLPKTSWNENSRTP